MGNNGNKGPKDFFLPVKYSKDAPFADPLVRCDSCAKVVRASHLVKFGMCECGNRKIRNLQTLSVEEMDQAKAWGVDPEFLALFEAVNND